MSDHLNQSIVRPRTFIALAVATVVFFVLGNQGGGKNGNAFIVGVPICLLLLIALGIAAFVKSRRRRLDADAAEL
jgi:lipopolysaccharide export LptBFGC system permease protein LptF